MNIKFDVTDTKTRCSARLSQRIDPAKYYSKDLPSISADNISVVIPVKNNQNGIDLFLKTLVKSNNKRDLPKEIIIVDNNSDAPLVISPDALKHGPLIRLLQCKKPGPAAARNMGVHHATGVWILFSDSDCLPTSSTIRGYIRSKKRAIALAGNVKATTISAVTQYYDQQNVLIPHFKERDSGEKVPLYIVTANALVLREAMLECGLFNESYKYAAGEDVDLGVRLWNIGNIEYELTSIVLHDYGKGIISFCKRFIRYGKGNWQLEYSHGMNMRAKYTPPLNRTLQNHIFRHMQCLCLNIGYTLEKYTQHTRRGIIRLIK